MNRNRPTKLKKMQLNSVDFVRRGANQEAYISLYKSADYNPDENMVNIEKAESDLTLFADVLGESFSSIMKDDTLNQEEKFGMIQKSIFEFNDTVDGYLSSLGIVEKSSYDDGYDYEDGFQTAEATYKSDYLSKGENEEMSNFDESTAGKVNPAKAKEEEEKNLPPAVQKALEEVAELKKSYEMKELENIAKKYEILGKKASEEAQILYDLKKSGESNYNAYIAAMDAQVDLVEKSGMFSEIGKSGNFNYSSVAKSEPETKIDTIAKSYMEADPTLDWNTAIAKAWENNPDLMAAYEQSAGF